MEKKANLRKDALGFAEVLFQGIAAVAPAGAAVATMTGAAAFALGSLPLSAVLAFLLVLLNAVIISRLSKRVASAGGYYAYVKAGHGKRLGIFTGMMYIFYQIMAISFVGLSMSVFVPAMLSQVFNLNIPSYLWFVLLLATLGLAFALSYSGIRESTRFSFVMAAIEMITVTVLGAILIVKSGNNTLSVFTPKYASGGLTGIALGTLFMYTAFAGFGNSTPLGEETKNAKTNISRALILTSVMLGAFFIFSAYAFTVAWGPAQMDTYASALVPGVSLIYDKISPYAAAFLALLFINSLFTGAVVLTNSTSRVMFDMGRDGVLPQAISSVQGKRLTPHVAAFVTFFSALFIASVSTLIIGGFNAFLLTATAATLGTLLVHVIINLSMPSVIKNSGGTYGPIDLLLAVAAVIVLAFVFYGTFLSISPPVVAGALIFGAFTIASVALALSKGR
ncbi:MAG: APC family permease [Thermoprotei archaeon]